jgi:polyphenol oxidase
MTGAPADLRPAGSPPLFAVDLPGAAVRFSTRLGGVSDGAYDSLNLGIQAGDEVERVVANRRLLGDGIGLGAERIAIGHQVHGAEIERWDAPPAASLADATAERAAVDGHVTGLRGVGLLVQVADCLPVALATPDAVAMVHCGWRGVAAAIVACAVAELGAVPVAVVGPGIGRCCFQVGPEVVESFADVPDAVDRSSGRADGGMLDLRAVVDARLRAAGVERVEHVDLCTHCRDDLFFSHRRDGGVTGRQCGIVWRT